MNLERKVLNGLERLSEAFKALLWEKAKVFGISPIQIQILMFVADHRIEICNVSYLAKEFNVTKATISDSVKVLLKKGYLEKNYAPIDRRRYNLMMTIQGRELVQQLSEYASPVLDGLSSLEENKLIPVFDTLSQLIFKLHQVGVIQVQRTCFNCRYYEGNRKKQHYCHLLESPLEQQEIRLDCPEFTPTENE